MYGDYAETDLDQPTDYSLQYQEEEEEAESAPTEVYSFLIKCFIEFKILYNNNELFMNLYK